MKILNTMIHQNNYKISVINYQMFKFEGQFFYQDNSFLKRKCQSITLAKCQRLKK